MVPANVEMKFIRV